MRAAVSRRGMMAIMRRFGRWAFNLLSALSLVLCVAVVVVSVRSHKSSETYLWQFADGQDTRCRWVSRTLGYRQGDLVFTETEVVFTFKKPHMVPPAVAAARAELPLPTWISAPYRSEAVPAWRWMGGGFKFTDKPPVTGGGRFPYGKIKATPSMVAYNRTRLIPLWSCALLFLTLPALWSVNWLRRRARKLACRCPNCGYDLRATPDRCPACGKPSILTA
jgi:hypothetical protein